MAMQGSEAIAISAVISDAVTELRIVENLVANSIKSSGRKTDKYFEEANFTHMNKILSKFSCYAHDKSSFHRKHRLQNNNNAAAEIPGVDEGLEATLEDCFNSPQYVRKLKAHLSDTIDTFTKLSAEISTSGTFSTLENIVKNDEDNLREIEYILARERESRDKIKELRSEIERQTKEGMQLVEQSKETIAHLKDQVQEMKAKAIMEEKYVTRYSTVRLEELQSRCEAEEQELRDEIKRISLMQDQESRVAEETRSYLHDRLSELNQKQEYWQERCQTNIEELRHRLEVLKAGKTKDLTRLHDLTIQYQEYEAVVLADRISKEKARQQAELMGMQEDASLKIQNWWRCLLIRRGLGPYAKKKKGKGRKGKAGKKVKK